jgi:hypothetical protein
MQSDKVSEAYAAEALTLLDDLMQLLDDAGHEDLAHEVDSIYCILDSRRARVA